MPQDEREEGELILRCSIKPFEGNPVLHLEAFHSDEVLSHKISFGLNKAYSLSDVLEVVVEYASTGELSNNPKGCVLKPFKGHEVLVIPHDSSREFSFGRRKAELVAHFAEAVQTFADTNGRSAGADEHVGADADAD